MKKFFFVFALITVFCFSVFAEAAEYRFKDNKLWITNDDQTINAYCMPADLIVPDMLCVPGTPDPEPPPPVPTWPIVLVAKDRFFSDPGWYEDPNGWMRTAEGNPGVNIIDSSGPQMQYHINVPEEGIAYVWIQGETGNASSDSVHFGIDGLFAGSITFLNGSWSSELQSGGRGVLTIGSGSHILNVWQREDGSAINAIRITNDINYRP